MTTPRTPILLALVLGLAPVARAQSSALFTDGTAFGGSRVFSEGLNPLGNPARFDLTRPNPTVRPGMYLTWADGGQEAQDFRKALDLLGNPARLGDGLVQLERSPWGLRTRIYGLGMLADNGHLSLTQEETTSLWARPDTAHLGTSLPLNQSTLDVRRSKVERLVWGVSGVENGQALGATLRVERWSLGTRMGALNPFGTQVPLLPLGGDPYDFRETNQRTVTATLDTGFAFELTQGIHLGGTVDRLVSKRLWDVEEKPQARLGLQVDIGTMAKLIAEMDLNEAERMPYPVKQRTAAASLLIHANPTLSFSLGAERRKFGEATVTRGGVTLRIHTPTLVIGAGFQFGQDLPLKGATFAIQ
jgi:hypothetical protein